jgi:preprotein translocase subunit SecE
MAEKKKSPAKEIAVKEEKNEQTAKEKATLKTASKTTAKSKKTSKKQNRLVKYFKDLKSEFKKVVWPSKQKVFNNTTVVVVSMTACGLVIWAIDTGLTQLLALIISKK